MPKYIHQRDTWPNFVWDSNEIIAELAAVRYAQGILMGKMEAIGFLDKSEAMLETLTLDVLKSHEIEGAYLEADEVRSSIARQLGLEVAGLVPSSRHTDGVTQMILDATQNFSEPLTESRLFGWHAALFPTGWSGMHQVRVGAWRDDEDGPMRVVSGPLGRERIHFIAPPASKVSKEMVGFLSWFNEREDIEPILKAAIAHLWFLTIHPFDDGNGRIARAIADLLLSRADLSNQRFYSLSAQIMQRRKGYYEALQSTQQGNLDITLWLRWFIGCLHGAIRDSDRTLSKTLSRARFWERHAQTLINERQKKMLLRLLDDFKGKLTTQKWGKITKCSPDTALRDIQDLIDKGILIKNEAGGRSTSYSLIHN